MIDIFFSQDSLQVYRLGHKYIVYCRLRFSTYKLYQIVLSQYLYIIILCNMYISNKIHFINLTIAADMVKE